MKLKAKKITLMPIEKEDIEIIHLSTSDYSQISPYFPTIIKSKSYWIRKHSENGLWNDEKGMLKVIDNANDTIAGLIWFFKGLPYAEGCEIAFNLYNKNQEKGLAVEAINVFSSYLFETYNLNRIQANTVIPKDHPSIRNITSQTGYVYEGTMRKAMFIRGKIIDLHLFSLLREDSKPLHSLLTE